MEPEKLCGIKSVREGERNRPDVHGDLGKMGKVKEWWKKGNDCKKEQNVR